MNSNILLTTRASEFEEIVNSLEPETDNPILESQRRLESKGAEPNAY